MGGPGGCRLGQAEAVFAFTFESTPSSLRIALTDDLTGGSHEAMGGRGPSEYRHGGGKSPAGTYPSRRCPASHLGVMSAPHVRGLADYLNEWVDEDRPGGDSLS